MEKKYYLKPGYIYYSNEGHIIETILGSCVSVCLWDKKNKVGIMTHYIYASHKETEQTGVTGTVALPFALKIMLENGSQKSNLEAHVIGGGKNSNLTGQVGIENAEYAKQFLNKHNLKIVTFDTGGEISRKVIFDTKSGELKITRIS